MSDYPADHKTDDATLSDIKLNHQAAADGIHLPCLAELLCGSPFMHGQITRDAAAWVYEMLPFWTSFDEKAAEILDQMLETPNKGSFHLAGVQLQALTVGVDAGELTTDAYRPFYYAASLGCPDSALQVARVAAEMTTFGSMTPAEKRELARVALGWLLASKTAKRPKGMFRKFKECSRVRAAKLGATTASLLGVDLAPLLVDSEEGLPDWTAAQPPTEPCPLPGQHLVVIMASVGSPKTTVGQRVLEEVTDLIGKSFPLVSTPNLAVVEAGLRVEFPHLVDGIWPALRSMHGRPYVKFRPMLLVGNPGTGKSRLAVRLLEALDVSPMTYSCGGVADASISGTSRRWDSSAPSLPLARIMATRVANPGIVLDELEKGATSRHNGNAADALLNLLEPQTSAAWMDPYLEAAVDLSHVCWIATANTIQGLSQPLLDRFRVVRVPEARPEHLEALGNSLVKSATIERGLHADWAMPLDGTELQALARIWQGGSLRRLAQLISCILDVRDAPSGGCKRTAG